MTGSTTAYIIRVKGHLDPGWTTWLEGLRVDHEVNGNTSLFGPPLDQAALYGLLSKIHALGLTLLSVNPEETNG
jgi:hypothetical protein